MSSVFKPAHTYSKVRVDESNIQTHQKFQINLYSEYFSCKRESREKVWGGIGPSWIYLGEIVYVSGQLTPSLQMDQWAIFSTSLRIETVRMNQEQK